MRMIESRSVQFMPEAWEDYQRWQKNDVDMIKRINELINNTRRDPFKGIGKPEPLKGDMAGLWSRRITREHRMVYHVTEDRIVLIALSEHYRL